MKNFELKRILAFLSAAALAAAATGCGTKTPEPAENIERAPVTDAAEPDAPTESAAKPVSTIDRNYAALFSNRDKTQECANIDTEITLAGDTASAAGDGVSVSGSAVTINKEGVYRITGTLEDGQIIVNAPNGKVQLLLDNAEINSGFLPAIIGEASDKLFITTAEGSVNSLKSGAADGSDTTEQLACLYSRDSITLNGLGTLKVTAATSDGIHSKDDIVMTGGTVVVDAFLDGIKGKDYAAFCGGSVTVKSGEDAIKSTNDSDPALGFVYIEGGEFALTSDKDGIQAQTDVVVTGGEIGITAGGGAENSTKVHTDDFGGGFPRGFNKGDMPEGFQPPDNFDPGSMTPPDGFDPGSMTPPDGFDPNMMPPDAMTGATPDADKGDTQKNPENTSSAESESDSTKGLKGLNSVQISGGTITVDSADDTIHSDSCVEISGGKLTLNSGDDGVHSGSQLTISGGETNITKSYEGLEGAMIDISGGIVELIAEDDGISASDGSSQMGLGTYSGDVQLNISGGSVYVDAGGDGIDSNGDMTISGGIVLVNGPTNGANGALDSNGKITVTGGTLVAAGSSGMAEYPDDSSTQHSVSATFDSSQKGGTLVTLLDSGGNELVSFAPNKSFQNIVISSPDISSGKTYTVMLGGSSSAESVHSFYAAGGYGNDGSEAGTFTADDMVSFIGDKPMGFGGFGGGKNKGDFQMPDGENGRPQRPNGDFGGRGGKDKPAKGDRKTT